MRTDTVTETIVAQYCDFDVYESELEYHKSEGENSPFWDFEAEELNLKEFEDNLSEFGDAYNIAFEDFLYAFGSRLLELVEAGISTPSAKEHKWRLPVLVEGRRMGWRNREGSAFVHLKGDTPEDIARDFIEKVLPQTDMNIKVVESTNRDIDGIMLTVSHHDSPTGEYYDVTRFDSVYDDLKNDQIDRMDVEDLRYALKKVLEDYKGEYEDIVLFDWLGY